MHLDGDRIAGRHLDEVDSVDEGLTVLVARRAGRRPPRVAGAAVLGGHGCTVRTNCAMCRSPVRGRTYWMVTRSAASSCSTLIRSTWTSPPSHCCSDACTDTSVAAARVSLFGANTSCINPLPK